MGTKTKCLSFALLFVLSLTALSTLSSNSVSAASEYDDYIQTTDHLNMYCYQNQQTQNLALNWFTTMQEASPNSPALLKLQEKLNGSDDSGWFVIGSQNSGQTQFGNYDTIQVLVTSQDATFTLDTAPDGYSKGLRIDNADYLYTHNYLTYYQYTNAQHWCPTAPAYSYGVQNYNGTTIIDGGPAGIQEYSDGSIWVGLSYNYSSTRGFFMANTPFIPPTDYAGEIPPTEITPFSGKLSYEIVDKTGTFWLNNLSEDTTNCRIIIDNNPSDADDAEGGFSEDIYEISDCNSDEKVVHKWQEYGNYRVTLEYTFNDELKSFSHTFEIDGSNYKGNITPDGNEDLSGLLQPEYEDCVANYGIGSQNGLDIVGGFNCVMQNFQKFIQWLFTWLFMPDPRHISQTFNALTSEFQSTLGFLAYPIVWTYDFFSAFNPNNADAINTCSWSFGNVFNRDFKLNFCSFSQQFPSAWTTAQTFIQAFTVFVLLAGLYQEYRRVLNT